MSVYLPPPTYADVVIFGADGQPKFNPIWLDWFVRLTQQTGSGGVSDHNMLTGLQGGTANQYYHFTAAEYAAKGTVLSVAQTVPAEFLIGGSPVTTTGTLAITKANQTANTVWAGPTSGGAAQPAFRALSSADGAVDAWASFATTRTGWTDVGTPTVTSRYTKAGKICFFQIKVVPATTVATTAGTSYCSLPVTAAGLAGDASMTDLTTLTAVGDCVIDVANSRVYVPSQVATGDSLLIAGWYEV